MHGSTDVMIRRAYKLHENLECFHTSPAIEDRMKALLFTTHAENFTALSIYHTNLLFSSSNASSEG